MKKSVRGNRAQSEIITTVLIILLVLAAIIILWTVIRKVIEDKTEDIGTEQFNVNIELQSAYINASNNSLKIEVHRLSGKGNLTSLRFVLEDKNKITHSKEIFSNETVLPEELETLVYEFIPENFGLSNEDKFSKVTSIKLVYGVKSVSGAPKFGQASNVLNKPNQLRNEDSSANTANTVNAADIIYEDRYCNSGDICNFGYCNSTGNCAEPQCNRTISENNILFLLNQSFSCPDFENIRITGDNATIDCKGNQMAHMEISNGGSFVTVKNCYIESRKIGAEFGYSITGIKIMHRSALEGWNYNVFENNVFNSSYPSAGSGIFLIKSVYNDTIRNNEFFGGWAGIIDDEGGYFNAYNNTFHDSELGIASGSRYSDTRINVHDNEFYNMNDAAIRTNNRYNNYSNNYIHDSELAFAIADYEVYGNNAVFAFNYISNNILENNNINFVYSMPRLLVYDFPMEVNNYCNKSFSNDCYKNTFNGNLVNGKPVYYWYNEHNEVIENIHLGYFSCAHCRNITLQNVNLTESNLYGVFLYNSTDITIKESEISNSNYGIFLANSSDNFIDVKMQNNYYNYKELDSSNNQITITG